MPGYEVKSVRPMKNPVQTECGRRDCLEPVLKHFSRHRYSLADTLCALTTENIGDVDQSRVSLVQSEKRHLPWVGPEVHVSELELQLQASLASTHNGSFQWCVPDFPDYPRRKRDAFQERITSIYSPPFYTGRNGYKMCTRAYLNRDGMGSNEPSTPEQADPTHTAEAELKQQERMGYYTEQSKAPKLADIVLESKSVMKKWRQLGLHLGVPYYILEEINMDQRGVSNKKTAMFNYWLENEQNPSWERLATALVDIDESKLANKIRGDHCLGQDLKAEPRQQSLRKRVKRGIRKIWGVIKEYTVDKILDKLTKFGKLLSVRRKYKTNKINDGDQRKVRWWFEIIGDESDLRVLEAQWKTITASEQWRLEGVQAQPNRS